MSTFATRGKQVSSKFPQSSGHSLLSRKSEKTLCSQFIQKKSLALATPAAQAAAAATVAASAAAAAAAAAA